VEERIHKYCSAVIDAVEHINLFLPESDVVSLGRRQAYIKRGLIDAPFASRPKLLGIPASPSIKNSDLIELDDDLFERILQNDSSTQIVVISGAGGSGKSELLRQIAWRLAEYNLQADSMSHWRLPIRLHCRANQDIPHFDSSRPWESIVTAARAFPIQPQLEANDLISLRDSGSLVLIIDGFDEIPDSASRDRIASNLRQLFSASGLLGRCSLLIASRPEPASLLHFSSSRAVKRLALEDFTADDIQSYIRLFFTDKSERGDWLLEQIKVDAPGLALIIANPLMLSLLCWHIYQQDGELQHPDETELMDYWLKAIFKRREWLRQHELAHHAVLRVVAYLHFIYQVGSIPLQKAVAAISQAATRAGTLIIAYSGESTEAAICRLGQESGMFSVNIHRQVITFSNAALALIEYLAGDAIPQFLTHKEVIECFGLHAMDPDWESVLFWAMAKLWRSQANRKLASCLMVWLFRHVLEARDDKRGSVLMLLLRMQAALSHFPEQADVCVQELLCLPNIRDHWRKRVLWHRHFRFLPKVTRHRIAHDVCKRIFERLEEASGQRNDVLRLFQKECGFSEDELGGFEYKFLESYALDVEPAEKGYGELYELLDLLGDLKISCGEIDKTVNKFIYQGIGKPVWKLCEAIKLFEKVSTKRGNGAYKPTLQAWLEDPDYSDAWDAIAQAYRAAGYEVADVIPKILQRFQSFDAPSLWPNAANAIRRLDVGRGIALRKTVAVLRSDAPQQKRTLAVEAIGNLFVDSPAAAAALMKVGEWHKAMLILRRAKRLPRKIIEALIAALRSAERHSEWHQIAVILKKHEIVVPHEVADELPAIAENKNNFIVSYSAALALTEFGLFDVVALVRIELQILNEREGNAARIALALTTIVHYGNRSGLWNECATQLLDYIESTASEMKMGEISIRTVAARCLLRHGVPQNLYSRIQKMIPRIDNAFVKLQLVGALVQNKSHAGLQAALDAGYEREALEGCEGTFWTLLSGQIIIDRRKLELDRSLFPEESKDNTISETVAPSLPQPTAPIAENLQLSPPAKGDSVAPEKSDLNKTPADSHEPAEKTTPKPDDITWSKALSKIKKPSENAIKAYRYWLAFGRDKNQSEIAAELTKELREPVTQPKISRWIMRVEKWIEAGNVLPDLGMQARRARPIDPSKLDMGKRQNRLTPRQRSHQSDDDDLDE
jgi:NACHT domain